MGQRQPTARWEPHARARLAAPGPAGDYGLVEHVGPRTVARARTIVAGGGILSMQRIDERELSGSVVGSRPRPYQTGVRYTVAAGRVRYFESDCDCPVAMDCKHGVAMLLQLLNEQVRAETAALAAPGGMAAHRTAQPPAEAPWERSLARLLGSDPDPLTGRPSGLPYAELGLQFDISVADPHDLLSPVRVSIRPNQRNSAGRWVSTGASWRELRYAQYAGRYAPRQLEVLTRLADLDIRRSTWTGQATWLAVDSEIGPGVWDALERAAAAGVALVRSGRDQGDVEVAEDPGAVSLDLTRAGAGSLTLSPTVRLAGEVLPPSRLRLIGTPAHGLVSWPEAPIGAPGRVVLGRLQRAPSAELSQLLAAGRITVPAEDEDRFFTHFLPRLRRIVTLESSDGSVPIPPRPAPRLVVSIEHRPDHELLVSTGWIDELGGRRRPLSDDRGTSTADRGALRSAQDAVIAASTLPGQMLLAGPRGPVLAPETMLTGAQTIEFLTVTWPILRGLPGVLTDEHGTPLDYRAADGEPEIRLGSAESASSVGQDWFDLALTVTIDGEPVPFELIFRALAATSSVIILASGTYFSLDGERWQTLRRLIDEARSLHDQAPDRFRVSRYTVSRWIELEETGLLGEQANQWRERIRRLDPAAPAVPAPVPAGVRAELRAYQRAGFDWLRGLYDNGLGGILADDMGLGKTLQTLALVAHARTADPTRGPFLVVAPTSVVPNWAAEARRFAPDLRVAIITEGASRRGRDLADVVDGADLVVTSYALFRLEHADYAAQSWAGLVLDEAQFVKNMQSKGFRCAKSLPAPFKLAVTGTPLENNLMELWALLSITAPGLFPDPRRFTEYYRVPIERGQSLGLLDQLRRRIRPFLLRRAKEEVAADLPPKQEQVIELDLSPRHQQVYQRHLQRERQKILGLIQDENALDANRFLILKSLTMLRQLSLDPSLVDEAYRDIPSSKLDVVLEQLTGIVAGGHRVLVFSQFTRFLAKATARLDALGIGYCQLDGKTRNRGAVIERFRSGAVPVFLVSLKAGGFGLNLTEADYCILLDPWWNPAAEAQAVDRAHRIGQTKTVMVYRYVAKQTIEEKVMALKAGKAKLFHDVLGADSDRSGDRATGRAPLSAAEIRELIA